ncbi:hypothetical protein [Sinorhizobium medicae]
MTSDAQIKEPVPANIVTDAMKSALKWLTNRNADGVFDKNQVLIAAGQRAPVMRSTWSRLEKAGLVERYMNNRRMKITAAGLAMNLRGVQEFEG